jgi:hypothetical protein
MEEIKNIEEEEIDWETSIEFTTPMDEWSTLDFYSIIKNRKKKGVTLETFYGDLKGWTNWLNSLVVPNKKALEAEILSMNFDCPANEHDIIKLEIRYSQLVGHISRLNEMHDLIFSHVSVFDSAYKSLKNIAMGLSSGTAKDKESNAEFLVQPLFKGVVGAKLLLTRIVNAKDSCENSATNLNRILRSRDAEQKMSASSYAKEGQMHAFDRANEENSGDGFLTADEMITRRKIKREF